MSINSTTKSNFWLSAKEETPKIKCGLVYEEGGVGLTGFIKEKIKTKAATDGPVCPDKCGADFLTEINTNCEINFTASCVESCDDTLPRIEDTTPDGAEATLVSYNNCCIVQGLNKEGDFNSYTFVDKDGIVLVSYQGNPTS